jgi:hypothetical protein
MLYIYAGDVPKSRRAWSPRGLMDEKEKYMRWMAMMWELHSNITREEKRKEEILEVFRDLNELAKHRIEAPYFPPWESSWR